MGLELTPKQEKAVMLFCEGMRYCDIAREIGVSEDRVRQLLRKAHSGGRPA